MRSPVEESHSIARPATIHRRGARHAAACALALIAGWGAPLRAEHPAASTIYGQVLRADNGTPLGGARVRATDDALATREATTDSAGRFRLTGLAAGPVELVAERVGYAPRRVTLVAPAGDSVRVFVRLAARSIQLDRIVVTAQEQRREGGGATTSRIGRDAIEHVQAASLADVLQLVPGQLAADPSLAGARQSLLRQALPPPADTRGLRSDPGGVAEDAARANALGTAVVLDGVPRSNNANLQTNVTILNSSSGTLPPFSSVAGRGIDLRQIPADNIESIEVIRGIPSARHGDLTSGAILVTTRAGARAPEVRLRANPTSLELSTIAGWGGLAGLRGVSADANVLVSQDDPRTVDERFTRATAQAAWTQPWTADRLLSSTVRLRAYTTLDERRRLPDDDRYQIARFSRDRGVQLDMTGAWRSDSSDRVRLDWTASASVARQTGFFQELITRDIFPVTDARTDTTLAGSFGRSEYLSRVTVDGRPVSSYLRLEGTARSASRGTWRQRPVAGIEWRRDENQGGGRQFDPRNPPRQNYAVGDRPRSFDEVPPLSILSAYLEDRVRGVAFGRPVDVSAGVRFDNIAPTSLTSGRVGTVLAPRVNAGMAATSWLRVRGGYGITAKAPTLAQLYPGPRYFDLVNFNYYALDPAERLVVITTRVVRPSAQGLRPYRTRKAEGGVELAWRRLVGSVIAFDERTTGAYGMSRQAAVFEVPKYRAASTPAGRPPVLDPQPFAVDTFIGAYDAPRATRAFRTRGLELTLDPPEWTPLRATLALSGGWYQTRAVDTDPEIDLDALFRGAVAPQRIGVYASGRGSESSQLATSARLVHRAPAAGLVASILVQTLWSQRDRPLLVDAALPIGYLDRTGVITPLTREQALSAEYQLLRRAVSADALRWESRPALWLVNLRLSKTLPGNAQLTFLANNALADRPLYQRRRAAGLEQRNPPLSFGLELASTFGALRR